MFTPATPLSIDPSQKHVLESLARAGTTAQSVARKCDVILLASAGVPNNSIAQQTGLSRPTVIAARTAFERGGVEALDRAVDNLAATLYPPRRNLPMSKRRSSNGAPAVLGSLRHHPPFFHRASAGAAELFHFRDAG